MTPVIDYSGLLTKGDKICFCNVILSGIQYDESKQGFPCMFSWGERKLRLLTITLPAPTGISFIVRKDFNSTITKHGLEPVSVIWSPERELNHVT